MVLPPLSKARKSKETLIAGVVPPLNLEGGDLVGARVEMDLWRGMAFVRSFEEENVGESCLVTRFEL